MINENKEGRGDLNLRTPNQEQRNAIKHSGGVLLSAGAGSGKTFVLVEHIVHLFEECSRNFKLNNSLDFSSQIRDLFGKIVLMTFTKKAAGELELRLQQRFQMGLEVAERERGKGNVIPLEHWEIALSSLHVLFSGTIHSFCYRLIKEGFIDGLTGKEKIITDIELEDKIASLFDVWISKNRNKIKKDSLDYILINKKRYQKYIESIFSDAEIRLLWSRYGEKEKVLERRSSLEELESILKLEFSFFWKNFSIPDISSHLESKKVPKWALFLKELEENLSYSDGFNFICSIENFFSKAKRFPPLTVKAPDEVRETFRELKEIQNFIKGYFKDVLACFKNQGSYLKNGEVIYEIYSFIEKNYLRVEGLTFSDLEYYVWRNIVGNKKVSEKVLESYDYFIIDEFQDTSSIQFAIVSSIISQDMGKVFAVGDVKQAIYRFRGGELNVFQETSELISKNLSLKNNYRSKKNIVSFNNSFFSHLFPLGEGYKGEDRYSVFMTEQKVPREKEDVFQGQVRKIKLDLSGGEEKRRITAREMDYIEACEIFSYLEANLDSGEISILYRKLAPSRYLLEELLNSDLGFTCQIKISLEDDPIIFLFGEFARIMAIFDRDDEVKLSAIVILKTLQVLGVFDFAKDSVVERLKSSFTKYSELGVWESFKYFLWSLNISSSNLEHSLEFLKLVSDYGGGDASYIYEKFNTLVENGEYSIEMKKGNFSDRIKIMSIHSSKGLEFDTVILGGMYTNGRYRGMDGFFGREPYSYKWFLDFKKKNLYKSLEYIKESIIDKKRSFSESKRLFYVATTRAVNRIVWIDLYYKDKGLCYGESWIKAIRLWESSFSHRDSLLLKSLERDTIKIEKSLRDMGIDEKRLDLSTPSFHKDPLGILGVEGVKEACWGISAELSVTRLSDIIKCPRMFFLRSIIRLDEDDIIIREEETNAWGGETNSSKGGSNISRGILVHEVISKMILEGFEIPLNFNLDSHALFGIKWIRSVLLERQKSSGEIEFVSEKAMKFALFGQMLSGIPDLIILEDKSFEIWDFKTGSIEERNLKAYWFQLYCYAYSLYLSLDRRPSSFKVILSFIDEKKNIEKKLSFREVESFLFKAWMKIENLDKTNKEYCDFCDYRKICTP